MHRSRKIPLGLTAEQQSRILSHIQVRVSQWVTSPIPSYAAHHS